MTIMLAAVLALAAILLFRPPGGAAARFLRAAGGGPGGGRMGGQRFGRGSSAVGRSGPGGPGLKRFQPARSAQQEAGNSLTLMVQQLAALLKGGRVPARLWDELWLVHGNPPGLRTEGRPGAGLGAGSMAMLGAVRAAAFRGSPVSVAIRGSVQAAFPRSGGREARIWCELAACFDIAEASGCPLAEVLARFAAQLEVEDDAEAARQTALAGPQATVSLLTWLPMMGLGLGMALGVDPLAVLIGTPLGTAALAAGLALTVAGRIWSARLVRAAAGAAAT